MLQQFVYNVGSPGLLSSKEYVLSYAEYGNKKGFPIFIQHGIVASIKDYELFDLLIKIGARIISIARPGYGYSTPYFMKNISQYGEIVSGLINKLGILSFDILGMSSGAPYSYSICNSMSNKVRNVYIFSGTPALYNHDIQKMWPYDINTRGSIDEFQKIAYSVFFSNLSNEDKERNDNKDSLNNDCFGIALDLMLRCRDWGFDLSSINNKVYMQHSENDNSVPYKTALYTSQLLPNCELKTENGNVHFSNELLNKFIRNVIEPYYL